MSDRQKSIVGIVLLIIIIVGDLITGLASSHVAISHDTTSTGVWSPFPRLNDFNDTNGQGGLCSVAGLSTGASVNSPSRNGDLCQFLNSESYWSPPFSMPSNPGILNGFSVSFSLNCISPANQTSAGSVFYLQYANYTANTLVWENSSNWNLIGSAIYVDNSSPGGTHWECPGHLQSSTLAPLPSLSGTTNTGYIFRVVGVCGCVSSNVPNAGSVRVNNIQVIITRQEFSRIAYSTSTNTIRALFSIQASFGPSSQTTITGSWFATNETSITCNLPSDHCRQAGTFTCTVAIATTGCTVNPITVTYPFAFTNTPVFLVSLSFASYSPWSRTIPQATMNVFSTQIGQL